MSSPVSPWDSSVRSVSPDGKHTAEIKGASEVGMGAPTGGTLRLSNGMAYERCNPSLVWSDDSEYLAVPQWTKYRMQRLLVISMSRRQAVRAPEVFRVLELHSFSQGKIRAVDSPIHEPQEIVVEVGKLGWK